MWSHDHGAGRVARYSLAGPHDDDVETATFADHNFGVAELSDDEQLLL